MQWMLGRTGIPGPSPSSGPNLCLGNLELHTVSHPWPLRSCPCWKRPTRQIELAAIPTMLTYCSALWLVYLWRVKNGGINAPLLSTWAQSWYEYDRNESNAMLCILSTRSRGYAGTVEKWKRSGWRNLGLALENVRVWLWSCLAGSAGPWMPRLTWLIFRPLSAFQAGGQNKWQFYRGPPLRYQQVQIIIHVIIIHDI